MSVKLLSIRKLLGIFTLLVSVAFLVGCDDGNDGAPGPAGPAGPTGPAGQDLTATLEPESCAVCHGDVGEKNHQGEFDKYLDESKLKMEILEVKSVAAGGAFDVTMTVKILKGGLPYVDVDGLPTFANPNQMRFAIQGYDSATRSYPNALNVSLGDPKAVAGQPGVYKVTATGVSYAPEKSNAEGYAYLAQGHLDTEQGEDSHVHLYDDVASAGVTFGDADTYQSYANVEGCQKCHGEPYRKHGYREAVVAGLPTFSSCKTCHMDDRAGGHEDWQQMVDDPVAWGNGDSPKLPKYAYTRRIMNDVHMSHAMEFPFPQSMRNCVTCHEGKMDKVTADKFFVPATCKSCHPVQSTPEKYVQANRAPALEDIWKKEGVESIHSIDANCLNCHSTAAAFAPTFAEIHTGYNPKIYKANGQRYSDLYSAEITGLAVTDGVLDIRFTANTALMTAPTALVSFYGYGTKEFIVSSHTRDADRNNLEKTIGTDNPYILEADDSVQGNWHLTFAFDSYALSPIQEMIDSREIRRLEVTILPTVEINGEIVATNAVSKTLRIADNAIDGSYFKGANEVVDVQGCNKCHDALGTTFHEANRGGNIVACKNCHVPSSGGSHLEMQTRAISGYVHAIHSFQAFDPEDIDFSDPVYAKRYALHIEHKFPNFSIKNCEACHEEGTFNVPDQTKSLPGVLSASVHNDAGPNGEDTWMRNIGSVPSYVVGPASKACGGCHRAHEINEDNPSGLAAFNQHTKNGGYLVEDGDWKAIVDEIMAKFE